MTLPQQPLDAKLHLAQIVQSAAHSAGCPVAVFYICNQENFQVAATFGCNGMDAIADRNLLVLNTAELQPDGLLIVQDIQQQFELPLARPWLFHDGAEKVRFVAVVQVAYAHKAACGLLVVADTVPHAGLTTAQQHMLRANAEQITVLLEYYNLHQTLRQRGFSSELWDAPSPVQDGNFIKRYYRRARLAEVENIVLEEEKAALEAEILARKRVEARLHYVAFHDDLTGLYNRQFFVDRLAAALQRLTVDMKFQFAVLLLDLDRFKAVNDSFGHRAGDLLLIEIAGRLRGSTRTDDVVARIGGDEFAVLIEGFEEADYVAAMAERLVEVVRYPAHLGEHEVFSAASIGVAQATKYYRLPEELLRDADIAMYQAKRQRAGFLIFNDSMHRTEIISSQLRTELQRAVTRSEFYVEYQPIFNLVTGDITGLEALIRWQHPTRGPLQPDAFIGMAEEIGLIRQIGGWILREACAQMRKWHDQYPKLGLQLSVNISGHQLTDSRFVPQLNAILESTGLEPASLQLEVTESVFLPSSDPIATVISDARALGVGFTLDDFGTGYSSLSYLDRYPIDAIKIDRSFVSGMPARHRTMSIVKAIIDLGRALNLEITAEGIENDSQRLALLAMGCKQAQGYLLSYPVSAKAIGKILSKQSQLGRRNSSPSP